MSRKKVSRKKRTVRGKSAEKGWKIAEERLHGKQASLLGVGGCVRRAPKRRNVLARVQRNALILLAPAAGSSYTEG